MSISVLSILSLMFGVFGMCLSCIFIGIFPCILSVILGCIALKDDMTYKWPSICGIACSAVGIIMAVVVMTQSESYNTPNVATPTEIVQNITSSDNPVASDSNITQSNSNQAQTDKDSPQIYVEQDVVSQAEQNMINEKEETTSSYEFDYNDMHVKYLKHEIVENLAGEKCLAIYYEFTNNSSENKAFDYAFSDTAFQNGVELDFSLFHVNEESKNSSREIQPGTTVTVTSGFVLGESRDNVTLQITPWISWSNKTLLEMDLSLQ